MYLPSSNNFLKVEATCTIISVAWRCTFLGQQAAAVEALPGLALSRVPTHFLHCFHLAEFKKLRLLLLRLLLLYRLTLRAPRQEATTHAKRLARTLPQL